MNGKITYTLLMLLIGLISFVSYSQGYAEHQELINSLQEACDVD